MTVNLGAEIEARLLALAQRSGISVEAFLQHVVEEKSGPAPRPQRLRMRRYAAKIFMLTADSVSGRHAQHGLCDCAASLSK